MDMYIQMLLASDEQKPDLAYAYARIILEKTGLVNVQQLEDVVRYLKTMEKPS